MEYRKLGKTGLKISELSYGSWLTFKGQMQLQDVIEAMARARDFGVNFFDNAEVYAQGASEELMGQALKKLSWSRLSYLVSTKLFWGIEEGVNSINTLNRKYLLESVPQCLKRLSLDHVDLLYCHRPDANTPLEETCHAMDDLITRGYALYWGTSEWSAEEIGRADELCQKNSWHRPIVEQPQYNLFHAERVENEYCRILDEVGIGLTTWSPLASGLLTGKHLSGIQTGTRVEKMSWLKEMAEDPTRNKKIQKFVNLSQELEITPGQLALLWCLRNPKVSTVITGSSRMSQLEENFAALEKKHLMTHEIDQKLREIFSLPPLKVN